MHLPEGATPTLLFLGGLGLMIFILLRRSYRYFGRREKAGPALPRMSRPDARNDEPLRGAPPELARWQVEMHETARELKGEIDSKLSLLQTLVGQARKESQRLEANLERARQLGHTTGRDTLDTIEALASELADEMATALPGSTDQRELVYSLAEHGSHAAEIAGQVGLPLGEVEMLLNLRA